MEIDEEVIQSFQQGYRNGLFAAAAFINSGKSFQDWYEGPPEDFSDWKFLLESLDRRAEIMEDEVRMPIYRENPEDKCIIVFGTGGWSSEFAALVPKDFDFIRFKDHAERLIPKNIKALPGNDKVKFMEVYRFEKRVEIIDDEKDN